MPVYFAQAVDGGPVKIGWSRVPEKRVAILATQHRRPIRLLATTPGGRARELWLHEEFAGSRAPQMKCSVVGSTEWFEPTRRLAALVAECGGAVVGQLADDVPADPRALPDAAIKLRDILRARDISNGEAAAQIGIAGCTIWHWLHGNSRPTELAAVIVERWSGGVVARADWTRVGGTDALPPLRTMGGNRATRAKLAAIAVARPEAA